MKCAPNNLRNCEFCLWMSILVIILYLQSNETFAISSAFPRQVIDDAESDFMDSIKVVNEFTGQNKTLPVDERCKNGSIYTPDSDIQKASFSSDGKVLNATLSTFPDRGGPLSTLPGSLIQSDDASLGRTYYSMHVDVNSLYDTGLDYTNQISGVASEENWERKVTYEPGSLKRQNISKPDPINFSIDLETLGNPDQYNVIFTTLGTFSKDGIHCSLQDITNFIPLPPPKLNLSTTKPVPMLRQGEDQTIEMILRSSSEVDALATFYSVSSNGVHLNFSPDKTIILPSGSAVSQLSINVDDNASLGAHTLPLIVGVSFPSQVKADIYGIELKMNNPVGVKINKSMDFTVMVLKPLQPHEYIANFVNQWINPLTGAITAISAAATGILGWLLGLRKHDVKAKST